MISVIVPVYEGATILPTTLPALAALDPVGEVILVDDGSTDGTADLLAGAEAQVGHFRIITMPENRGRSAARNAGVQAARGDVLVFFDADVEPSVGGAHALAQAARAQGAVSSVARLEPVATVPHEPFQDYVCHHPRGPAAEARPGEPIEWRFFLSGACAIRRDVFQSTGGFPTDVPYGEDVALACRLAGRHPHGLRLADAAVRLHDLGDLARSLRHAEQFGQAAAAFQEACPCGALDRFRRAGRLGWATPLAVPLLEAAVRSLEPGPWRRRAVRYLLASTALRAARRA